ncbi:MAG TPA: RidA family protein [Gemmatimonadales bacterium]|jgi:2-iminobutanoate/2-iminopropanoate deaminase
MKIVATEGAPAAIGPYSQAVIAGDQVFTAGQIALDPATGEMVGADVTTQTERVFDNLSAVLGAAGSSLADVVKATVYLASMSDFPAMNAVYARRFGTHKPARSTVQAAGLPKGALVEIDLIARRS